MKVKEDFITFNTPDEAKAFSTGLSDMIDLARNTNKAIRYDWGSSCTADDC